MRLEAAALDVALGAQTVLHGVDLALAPRELTGVLGANGAGKSTLLRTLAGILAPARGSVRLDGRDLASLSPDARARAIGYLPQAREVAWPVGVRELVGLGRLPFRALGAPETPACSAAIEAALRDLDLAPLAVRPATELSGGELARVLIARVVAQETPVILADEPAAGLDPAHRLAVFELLARLSAEGRAIAVAVHDLSLAARFARRLVVLEAGRIIADGPPSAALSPEILRRAFRLDAALNEIDGVPVVVAKRAL